jgi:hypothetical protein
MPRRPGPLENATIKDLIVPELRAAGWDDDQLTLEHHPSGTCWLICHTRSLDGRSHDVDP